jgi:hypothetical protein
LSSRSTRPCCRSLLSTLWSQCMLASDHSVFATACWPLREHLARSELAPAPDAAHFALCYLQHNRGKLIESATLLRHESLDTTALYTRPPASSGVNADGGSWRDIPPREGERCRVPEDPSDEEVARSWTLSVATSAWYRCVARRQRAPVCAAVVRLRGYGSFLEAEKRCPHVSSITWTLSWRYRRSCLWPESGDCQGKRTTPNESGATELCRSSSRPATRTCGLGGLSHSRRAVH